MEKRDLDDEILILKITGKQHEKIKMKQNKDIIIMYYWKYESRTNKLTYRVSVVVYQHVIDLRINKSYTRNGFGNKVDRFSNKCQEKRFPQDRWPLMKNEDDGNLEKNDLVNGILRKKTQKE